MQQVTSNPTLLWNIQWGVPVSKSNPKKDTEPKTKAIKDYLIDQPNDPNAVRFDRDCIGTDPERYGLVTRTKPPRVFALSPKEVLDHDHHPTGQFNNPTFGLSYRNFEVTNEGKYGYDFFAYVKVRRKQIDGSNVPILIVQQNGSEDITLQLYDYFIPKKGPKGEEVGPLMFLKLSRIEQDTVQGVDFWKSYAPQLYS